MRTIAPLVLLLVLPFMASTQDPDCSGTDRWPTMMAFVYLRNAGITDNDKLDLTKTRTTRLASQKIADDLYHQVHHVVFTEKSGRIIEVITSNDASNKECSMSGVEIFVISNHLGGK